MLTLRLLLIICKQIFDTGWQNGIIVAKFVCVFILLKYVRNVALIPRTLLYLDMTKYNDLGPSKIDNTPKNLLKIGDVQFLVRDIQPLYFVS